MNFTARLHCTGREYRYYFYVENLNLEKIQEAAKIFEGEHDFRNFCKMKPEYIKEGGTTRTIKICKIKLYKNRMNKNNFLPMAVFICKGNGFLYHQIRCILAVIKAIGKGLFDIDLIYKMFDINNNKVKFLYTMDLAENLLLYDCEYKKDMVNFKKPNLRCKKFIKSFFSSQYQMGINRLNLVDCIRKSLNRNYQKDFKVLKKITKRPFRIKKLK